jgi:hypothetical protein
MPRGGRTPAGLFSIGVFALAEGAVGDALQQFGIVSQRSEVSLLDRFGMNVEMFVAERLKPRQGGIDRSLALDEDFEGLGVFFDRRIVAPVLTATYTLCFAHKPSG